MKLYLALIITIVVAGATGLGAYQYGHQEGYYMAESMHRNRPISSIRTEYQNAEKAIIQELLSGRAGLNRRDEGGLWKTTWVNYFQGEIVNDAVFTSAKDIVIKVEYISQTGSVIGSENFTIYEMIHPKSSEEFRIKISQDSNIKSVSWSIQSAAAVVAPEVSF